MAEAINGVPGQTSPAFWEANSLLGSPNSGSDSIPMLYLDTIHAYLCPRIYLTLGLGTSLSTENLISKTTEIFPNPANNNINIAIGTDSSASNNRLDMFAEMRSMALNNKGLTMKSEFLKPSEVINMATINGAKALGLDNITGSIVENKYADIIAVNLDRIDTQPCYDPLASLVYCADRTSVEYVWINGDTKLKERVLLNVEENEILQKVKLWKNKINQT